jgi:hypothetical protein
MSEHKARHAVPTGEEQALRPPEEVLVPVAPPEEVLVPVAPPEAAHGVPEEAARDAIVDEHDPDPYARRFAIEELTGPGDEGD